MWKIVGNALLGLLKAICPKSRWGNIIYLVVGYAVANGDQIEQLLNQIVALFK